MKDMVYRLFAVDADGECTVYGYQKGEKAQQAYDSFIAEHPEHADKDLHCVLWSWKYRRRKRA
jgi:hypothetical protein